MRFLRRLTLNRRAAFDNSLYVDTDGSVIMDSRTALKLPHGLGDDTMPSKGFGDADFARVTCPIGLPGIGGKSPSEIAVAVAAQLLLLGK